MGTHAENRDDVILKALAEELVGPRSGGTPLDFSPERLSFPTPADANGPWLEAGTGQEVLTRDKPTKRYGVAVLYPIGTAAEEGSQNVVDGTAPEPTDDADNDSSAAPAQVVGIGETVEEIGKRSDTPDISPESDDFELTPTNTYKPSSIGVTFLVELTPGAELSVNATGGRYVRKTVSVGGYDRIWWLRRPWSFNCAWHAVDLCGEGAKPAAPNTASGELKIEAEIYSRPFGSPSTRMVTVSLVNRTSASGPLDEQCLFQVQFEVTIAGSLGTSKILPYPDASTRTLDSEEESIKLLYRHAQTYAVGHGCSADWDVDSQLVRATCFPTFETRAITPDIKREDGSKLEVSMALLAGLVPNDDGFQALNEVVDLYSEWIELLKTRIPTLSSEYQPAAQRHLDSCTTCLDRMRSGLTYLRTNANALEAFKLANHAVLLQQLRGRREPRHLSFDSRGKPTFTEPFPTLSYSGGGKGQWRAFQIAFLLTSIESTANGASVDRKTVELIWFPTGGGKTEAYLGLAAFSMFMRRIRNQNDVGVQVLMRYTLRLLTAQQFQRASSLIVAMEYLRRKHAPHLGDAQFSIGIWLGGATTPNTCRDAVEIYRSLERGEKNASNKLIVSRCAWCGAHMGPLKRESRSSAATPKCPGYERSGPTVIFKCTDSACDFSQGLPIYVIDEDIYRIRPALVIGTVDKFAMLAWRPTARALFGLSVAGVRTHSPPGLVIQDELHLISGPLGSMVGLYEGLIEELSTDYRGNVPVHPKIASSTATIRRFEAQVTGLYGRERVHLFPPPGLEAGDSFFACYDANTDGSRPPGRKFVGVYAPGLGSLQTVQVRTFCALLQAPMKLPGKADQDPWWTLLTFFNSLRELGTTLSLFQSDIPDYQNVLRVRFALKPAEIRRLKSPLELTGRLRGDEVQDAIDSLDTPAESSHAKAVDVCLASNIIEVGVDIDRLSLICIVGQPKTTSQYIQVTGRIGRRRDRPGLVVTIYGASKPRDRSHFERFRSYHEKLYAHVEPTSVTPFSPPALDRGLHAVMAAFARQSGSAELASNPQHYPEDKMRALRDALGARVRLIDPLEEPNFQSVFGNRERQWKRWQRVRWDGDPSSENTPLLREAGAYAPAHVARISWPTPMSMRNVDAECQIEITQSYLDDDLTDDGDA